MKKCEMSIEQIIQSSVRSALAVFDYEIEAKLQLAIKAGIEIGAAIGAEVGAKAAVQAVEREKRKFRKGERDKRYQNTKMLLRNYRMLKEHFENAVFDAEAAEDYDTDFAEIMSAMNDYSHDESLYVESIKKSALRTKIIMTHVNKMIECYEIMCERSTRTDDKRHSRVLRAMYLDDVPQTAATIANDENIDKRTVYKDIDAAVSDIHALLFGIDGLQRD